MIFHINHIIYHTNHITVIKQKMCDRHQEVSNPMVSLSLQWRHNGCNSILNHQPHDCLLNRLFRRRSKKTWKLCVTGLCAVNSPGTGEFPAQIASYVENVSIWWRHHGCWQIHRLTQISPYVTITDDVFAVCCKNHSAHFFVSSKSNSWSSIVITVLFHVIMNCFIMLMVALNCTTFATQRLYSWVPP